MNGHDTGCPTNGASPPAGRWHRVEAGLREMGEKSRPNWDGYGADAARPELIEIACGLLRQLSTRPGLTPPYVAITRVGGAMLEWEQSGNFAEIEVDDDGTVEILYGSELTPYETIKLSTDISAWPDDVWEALRRSQPTPVAT